jgi:ketosteroid isomerase-like protein
VKHSHITLCVLAFFGTMTVLGRASFVQQPGTAGNKTDAETSLRKAVERFIASADKADVDAVAAAYDPAFTCVRVADEGGVVRLSREQILQVFKRAGGHTLPTKDTTIHHVEIIDDLGYVLLTRTKDMGKGFEPLYYNFIWKRNGAEWRLLREFVHQRTLPKWK